MGKQPQARKRRFISRHKSRLRKTKNYRKNNLKDLDEVHDTIKKEIQEEPQKLEHNDDLPGAGQWYCTECSRFFIDEETLEGHKRSKLHKKRVKDMKDTPYSQAEADAAAGLGNYTVKRKKEDNDLFNGKKMRTE